MLWAGLVVLVIALLGELIAVIGLFVKNQVERTSLRCAGPNSIPAVPEDGWICPDLSEIARVLAAPPAPRRMDPRFPVLSDRSHPLWDRDLDP